MKKWDGVLNRPARRRSLYFDLTLTELVVLQTACAGAGTRDKIAECLGISPRTAATHLYAIYGRLQVRCFAEMILFALRDPDLRRLCFPEIKRWRDEKPSE